MKVIDVGAAYDPQFERVDTPRTNEYAHNIGNDSDGHYVVDIDFARQLERELANAQAEITRLKGEAESWEKVFDKTCEHLADAKSQLAEAVAKERERCARVCEEQTKGKSMWIEGARACAAAIRKGE